MEKEISERDLVNMSEFLLTSDCLASPFLSLFRLPLQQISSQLLLPGDKLCSYAVGVGFTGSHASPSENNTDKVKFVQDRGENKPKNN